MQPIIGTTKELTVTVEHDQVLLILDGRLVATLPWQSAHTLGKAITFQANKAEENAKAEQVIFDQAILTRLGVPMGLTNDPWKLKQAANEAAWNTKLRRYIPPSRAGGIQSQAVFGSPTVRAAYEGEGEA